MAAPENRAFFSGVDDRAFSEQVDTLDLVVGLLRSFDADTFLEALGERAGESGGERLRSMARAVRALQRAAVCL